MNAIKTLLSSLISIFYPSVCLLCSRTLIEGEKYFCLHCFYKIPLTNYHHTPANPAEDRLKGKIPYEKISSFLYYTKGGETQKIIAEIKYKGNRQLGEWMGKWMSKEMLSSDFFEGIDMIIPVPLHKKKQKIRGYNQAEEICKGICCICNIPMNAHLLVRKTGNPSQTKKTAFERWVNTKDIFDIKNPSFFENKHILIIDDVLTTGSTIEACVHALLKSKNVKVSILTLAITQ